MVLERGARGSLAIVPALIIVILLCQMISLLPGASGEPNNVPTAPQHLKAVPGPDNISLSWGAPTYDGGTPIQSYWIYLVQITNWVGPYPDDEEPIAKLGSDARSFLHSGLYSGTTYIYYVKAKNANGLSPYSEWSWATPGLTVPGKPELYGWIGDGFIELRWVPGGSGGTAVTSFNVYRGLNATNVSLVASTYGWSSYMGDVYGNTYYTDNGLTNWINYTYYVTVVNSMGESTRSNIITKRPMEAPRNLTATPSSVGHCGDVDILVNWTFPDDQLPHVIGFKTYRDEFSNHSWQSNENRSYTFHVSGGWGYSFRVSAVYDTGEESFSEPLYVGAPMCEGMGWDWTLYLISLAFVIAVILVIVAIVLKGRGRKGCE